MNDSSMESMTGMPTGKKKTRRGKRSRGAASAPAHPHSHLDNARKAHDDGDHAGAKRHAFAFVKSLPTAAPVIGEPDMDDAAEPVKKAPLNLATALVPDDEPTIATKPSGASKLAAMLKARKKT